MLDNFDKKYSALDNMMLRISGMEEPIEWKSALKEYLLSK
jgi:dTDP-4-dehydrorhamnose reductase